MFHRISTPKRIARFLYMNSCGGSKNIDSSQSKIHVCTLKVPLYRFLWTGICSIPETLDPQKIPPEIQPLSNPKSMARDSRPPETRSPQNRPQSGSPELTVCINIMQEPMLGHLTVLRSPVPSASGSPKRTVTTDPDLKSVKQKRVDPHSSESA